MMSFLNGAVTYVVYPNLCFELNIGTQEKWKYPLVIFIFSCMDFMGKTLNSKVQLKAGWLFYTAGVMRLLFVALFLFPHYFKEVEFLHSVWYGIGVIGLCAFSNGIIGSACFSIPAEVGTQEIRKVSSYLILTGMFLGITFGSFWPILILN
jgi:hypothetical protein